jgi:hypothetical protein
MGFNPLEEKGIALDSQIRNWRELTGVKYDKRAVRPYTRCRVITLNGAEFEGIKFSHEMARHVADPEAKRRLALVRRIEQQQQKVVAGMIPGDETVLETTLGYEQVAVDLTAWLARNEPLPHVRSALEFALLEDFDHLYRYANLLDRLEGTSAETIIGKGLTEVMPGRPTVSEHRHPLDSIRMPIDGSTVDFRTQMNVMTIVAGEQQTMNFYMNMANSYDNDLARALFTEIGMIEEQHVTHYESLMDPTTSWYKRLVMHEYNECYLYHSFWLEEEDPAIKRVWEMHLNMEVGHLREAVELMKKFDRKDPAQFLPKTMPEPIKFTSNADYVRKILAEQIELTENGFEYGNVNKLPKDHRFFGYNSRVNEGFAPSQDVISQRIGAKGEDFRLEKAPHPVERFRNRKQLPPSY